MEIKFKRMTANAVMPTKAHVTDAGLDLTCTRVTLDKDDNIVCHTDIAVEIPIGFVGLIYPRSSISKKRLRLTNSVGVIDSGYTGEITCKFKADEPIKQLNASEFFTNLTNDEYYCAGERIAQMIIMPIPDIRMVEVDKLADSERGSGGYGSTGK